MPCAEYRVVDRHQPAAAPLQLATTTMLSPQLAAMTMLSPSAAIVALRPQARASSPV
jgi:hypothetical protein